ncbi:MAG: hypothetical protein QXH32_02260 [Candidatus Caldarchaeum sp.]
MRDSKKRRDYSKIALTKEEAEILLDSQSWCYVASRDSAGNLWNLPVPFVRKEANIYFLDREGSIIINNIPFQEEMCVVVDTGYSYNELAGLIMQGWLKIVDDEQQPVEIYDLLTKKYPQARRVGISVENFKLLEFTPSHEINKISWHFGKGRL